MRFITLSVCLLVAFQSLVAVADDDRQQPSREQLHARARVMLQSWQMEKLSRQTWEQKRAVIEVLFSTPVPLETLKRIGGNSQEFWRALFGLDPDFARRNEYLQIAAESHPPINSANFAFQYAWLMNWSQSLIDEGATPPAELANRFAAQLLQQPPISGQMDIGGVIKTFQGKALFKQTEDDGLKELVKGTLKDYITSLVNGDGFGLPYKMKAASAIVPADIAYEVIEQALSEVERIEASGESPEVYKFRVSSLLWLVANLAGSVAPDKAEELLGQVQELQARTRVKNYVMPFADVIRELKPAELDENQLDAVYAYIDSIGEANQKGFDARQVLGTLDEDHLKAVVERTLKRLQELKGKDINSRSIGQFLSCLPSKEARRSLIDGWLEICEPFPEEDVRASWLSTIASLYTSASAEQQQKMRDRFVDNVSKAKGYRRFEAAIFQRSFVEEVSIEEVEKVIQILAETPPPEGGERVKNMLIRDYSSIVDRMTNKTTRSEYTVAMHPFAVIEFDPQTKREDLPKPETQLDERYLRIARAIDLDDPDKLPDILQNPELGDRSRIPLVFQFLFARMGEEQKSRTVDRLLQLAEQKPESPAVRPGRIVFADLESRLPLKPLRPLIYAAQYLKDSDRRRVIEFYLRHGHDIPDFEMFEAAFADAVAWSDEESCVAYWKLLQENRTAKTNQRDVFMMSILAARLHPDAIRVCAQAADKTLSAVDWHLVQRAMLERVKRASAEEQQAILAQLSKGTQTGMVKSLTESLSNNLRIINEADTVIDEFKQLLAEMQQLPSVQMWERFQKLPFDDALQSKFENVERIETVRELLTVPAQTGDQWYSVLSRVALLSKGFAASTPDELLEDVLDRYALYDKFALRSANRYDIKLQRAMGFKWLSAMGPAAATRLMPIVVRRMENESVLDSWQDFNYALALTSVCSENGLAQFHKFLRGNLEEYLRVDPVPVVEYLVKNKVYLDADDETLQKIVNALKSSNSVKVAEEKLLLLLKEVTGQEFASRDAAIKWIQAKFPAVDLVSNPRSLE